MFYSYHILVRKNSNFALIWRFMHDKKKVNRNELLALNVGNACNDLRGYVPTGSLSLFELQNKMSLYLLGQLLHGIAMVHEYQVAALCHCANDAAKSLLRVSKEERKRKRKTASDDEEDQEEQEGGYEEVLAGPKKKKLSKALRNRSILDLNDPSSYVSEQPSRNMSSFMDPFIGVDDMFQVPGMPETRFEPAEEFLKIQEEVADFRSQPVKMEQDLAIDVSLKDPKVSVGWYGGFDDESVEGMRARTTSGFSGREALKESALFEEFTQPEQIQPPPPTSVPVYRQGLDEMAQESQDEFMLEPLPEIVKDAAVEPKRRKRKHLIVDDIMSIASEKIMAQLNDYSDLMRPVNEMIVNCEELKKLPTSVLFNPRPWHINNLNSELFPLFDSIITKEKLPGVTFEEALHCNVDELRNRYWRDLSFEVQSWTSDMLNETLDAVGANAALAPKDAFEPLQQQFEEFQMEEPPMTVIRQSGLEEEEEEEPRPPQKVSMAEFREFSPEPINESVEARRRSSFEPPRFSLPQAEFDELDFSRYDSNRLEADDFDLARPSMRTARELSQRTFEAVEVNEFYQNLVEVAGTNICKFSDLTGERPTKREAAKKFYILLCLLKQKEIKTKQTTAYGDILIRLCPPENE